MLHVPELSHYGNKQCNDSSFSFTHCHSFLPYALVATTESLTAMVARQATQRDSSSDEEDDYRNLVEQNERKPPKPYSTSPEMLPLLILNPQPLHFNSNFLQGLTKQSKCSLPLAPTTIRSSPCLELNPTF